MPETDPIVAEINRKVEMDVQATARLYLQSQESIAFYFGNQWSKVSASGLVTTRPAPGEIRHTSNFIRPVTDRKISKLTSSRPIYAVTPSTGEPDDVKHATVTEGVLQFAHDVAEADRKIVDATWWACNSHRVWFKFFYNPFAGRRLSQPIMNVDLTTGQPTGEPLMDENGQPMMQYAYEGLPDLAVRTIFEMVWQQNIAHESQAKWCIEKQVMLCDEVEEQFGVRPEPEPIVADGQIFSRYAVEQMRGGAPAYENSSQYSNDQMCRLYTYWMLPCKKYPKGLAVIATSKQIVKRMDFPYEHGMLPFVGFSERHVGGSLYGNFVTHDLVPIQTNINIRRSQIMENCDLTACPPLMFQKGCGFNREQLNGMPGESWSYNGGGGVKEPYYANPGHLSSDAYKDLDASITEFYKVAESEVLTQAVSPDASWVAIQGRIEEDESVLGNTRAQMASALKRGAKMWLSNIRQFMPAGRIIRVVGKDKRSVVMQFAAEDVRPDFDVSVELEAGTRRSKTVKNATLMQLIQYIGDKRPEVMDRIIPLFEVGGLEAAFRESTEDQSFVDRQIERVKATGAPEPPQPYEKTERTASMMQLYLASSEYETTAEPARSAILQTWQLKQQKVTHDQQNQMMQMIAQSTMMAQAKGMSSAATGASPGLKGPLTEDASGPAM